MCHRSSSYFFLLLMLLQTAANALRVDNLRVVSVDANSITLRWNVIGSSDSSAAATTSTTTDMTNGTESDTVNEWLGFKIKYFSDKLIYTPILLGNRKLRKFRLDNLRPSVEYKIQVSAYNRVGNEGPASNLLTVITNESGKIIFLTLIFTKK